MARLNKVLLIQPPFTLLEHEVPSIVPPLGLAYIAAVLEREGYDVTVLDAVVEDPVRKRIDGNFFNIGLSFEKILKEIERKRPSVVGVSCLFSSQSHNAQRVAGLVKEVDDSIAVIFGGAHPSSIPHIVLQDGNVDFVVIGEGERTFLELLSELERGSSAPSKIRGIAFRRGKEVVRTQPQEYIKNLDFLPFPARHLLPMEKYLKQRTLHGSDVVRPPATTMITSRGCPFNCVFCSIHTVFGWQWRSRSPGNVVDEIEALANDFGVREIHFEDDNLTFDAGRMQRIADEIVERGLDIKWTTPNGVAVWTLDKTTLVKMKESGCYKLCFGIESGDVGTLKFIRKPLSLERARSVIKTAKEVGIWTHAFFVIGFPFEPLSSINKTLDFAKSSGVDFANFFIATPYPGTDLYKIMVENGFIPNEPTYLSETYFSLRTMKSSISTRCFTSEQLDRLLKICYDSFVMNKVLSYLELKELKYLFKRVRAPGDWLFLLRLGKRFLQLRKK